MISLGLLVIGILRSTVRRRLDWSGMALAFITLTIPVVELTNSHFFNVRMGPLTWLVCAAVLAMVMVPVAQTGGVRGAVAAKPGEPFRPLGQAPLV
jgi:hypothetical protein